MKKTSIWTSVLVLVLCLCTLCACGGRDFKEELPGEWYVWHWYYNTKDGENGFFETPYFYVFGADGKLTVKLGEDMESAEVVSTGTYKFVSNDTIDVSYADGTTDSFQLISSSSHPEQIQLMNVDTIYTVTLQPMSSWKAE